MIVKVYRNLKYGRKTEPLYSVQYKGRVIAHVRRILLRDAKFVVRESGRQRVLRENRKNVHAFVVGEWARRGGIFGTDENSSKPLGIEVRYNPYDAGYFYSPDSMKVNGTPVHGAQGVLSNERGISACYTC